jgi:hypothetical protein
MSEPSQAPGRGGGNSIDAVLLAVLYRLQPIDFEFSVPVLSACDLVL